MIGPRPYTESADAYLSNLIVGPRGETTCTSRLQASEHFAPTRSPPPSAGGMKSVSFADDLASRTSVGHCNACNSLITEALTPAVRFCLTSVVGDPCSCIIIPSDLHHSG